LKLAEAEEVKREIEELEEGVELREEKPREAMAPSTESREDEIEERRRRLRELLETYRDATSFAKELRDLSPEERAMVHGIVKEVFSASKPETKLIEKPIVVEKPVIREIEKPVPVIPESVERIGRKAEVALERVGMVEGRLSRLEEALEKLAEAQRDVAVAVKAFASNMSESERLREELKRVREELEKLRRDREEKYMIVPRAEKMNPDGTVIREYDFHPALKALEKRSEFMTEKLGPALIQELRLVRQDISSSVNRLATLIESVVTPELRRRAPRLVEDIEESIRRLAGGFLSPKEREKELSELEAKLEQLEKKVGEGGEKHYSSTRDKR